MLNKIEIMGRLTADPELKTTASGYEVCTFCIACDRDFTKDKDAKKVDFFNVVAWNSRAKFICDYFKKGQLAVLIGRLQTRTYVDGNDQRRTATEILLEDIYFAGSKNDRKPQQTESCGEEVRGYASPDAARAFEEITGDEDLPF